MALSIFKEAIDLLLSRWTAFQIALEYQALPNEYAEITAELCTHILNYFQSNGLNANMDELEENLLFYFEDDLGVQLEDGSGREVANRLYGLFKEIVTEGKLENFELMKQKAKINIQSCQNMGQESDVQMKESNVQMEETPPATPKLETVIDQDGFELVQKGRRKKH
jgi:hypothetical protein